MEEDSRTEFKRQLTKESMKAVVAFSNTKGGDLYIGIDNDGSLIGLDNPDSVSLDIVHLLTDTIRPDVTATTDVKRISMDGKNIIQIAVQEGPSKPYYLREKGLRPEGVYIRRGPSSVQAPEALILRMIKESSESFESCVSVEQNLTFETASKVFAEAGVEFGDSQKASMGFYSDGLYTVLAYLISDQCTFGIKLAAYSDRYKTEFLDRREVHGSILVQAENAMQFLRAYNPLRSRINGLRRTDYRAYPETALREVLINAVVHRDYSVDADILVSVFKDGIVVSSYGGLKRGLGIDDILVGISSRRNPNIASIFYRLGFIESYGTGIPRIMGEYKNALIKPSIELTTNVFKFELPALAPPATDQISVDAVMELAASKDSFTRSEVEDVLKISKSKAGLLMSSLVSDGILEKIGSGRSVRYRIPKI